METLIGSANRGSVSTEGYQIENSCLFDSASSHRMYFNPDSTSSTAERRKGTISFWVKRTTITHSQNMRIFHFGENTDGYDSRLEIEFKADDTMFFYPILTMTTEKEFRDPSAWYHIVWFFDCTQAEQSGGSNHANGNNAQCGLWVNGVRIGNDNGLPAANTAGRTHNSTAGWGRSTSDKHAIGYDYLDNTGAFNGYLAEFHAIQGLALEATDFGEFNDDGIWVPIEYTGTAYGTNGFYLKFDNSADMGNDSSSEGNDFTLVNIAAANQMEDSPTNNFCTLNPLKREDPDSVSTTQTISMGNLKMSMSGTPAGYSTIGSTMFVGSGKWYYELKIVTGGEGNELAAFAQLVFDADSPDMRGYNNRTSLAWEFSTYGSTYHYDETNTWSSNHAAGLGHPPYHGTYTGYILLMALDMDNGNVWVGYGGEDGEITGSNPGNWNGASSPRWERTTAAQSASAQGDPGNNLYPTNYGLGTNASTKQVWSIIERGITLAGVGFNWGGSNTAARAYQVNFGCPTPGWTINTGNSDANGYGNFEFPPPTGFYAMCTKNLAQYG